MTDPIEYIVNTAEGERSITINPVNITPLSGTQYSTGDYALSEGVVGLGMITFNTTNDWAFDGITDILSDADIEHIAEFIKRKDHTPAGIVEEAELEAAPPETVAAEAMIPVQTFNFVIDNEGTQLTVNVVVNYPLYDIAIDELATAQMEQDHHSNWYLTQGQLSDRLVQEIGRQISAEITGV